MNELKRQPKTQMSIALVELPATEFGRLNGKIKQHIWTGINIPRATPLLYPIIKQSGYPNVRVFHPESDGSRGILSEEDMKYIAGANYLMISAVTGTILPSEELARWYKERNPQGKIVVGGHHATFLPEEVLKWADVVVRKAGDKTLPELLRALGEGAPLNGIKGISYKKNGEIVHEPDREILSSEELSQLPIQEYDKRTRRAMRTSTLWTSRGCTLKCDFCSVTAFNEECYRRRSIESILRDVERVLGEETPHTFITDDNFPAAQAATIKLEGELKTWK